MLLFSIFFAALFQNISPPQKAKANPPGTVQVDKNLFVDTETMRNMDWKEFLFTIKKDSSTAFYRSMIPDTSKFVNHKNYFNSPEFAGQPLTGITYQQALAFCKWRSDLVSAHISDPKAVCEAGQPLYFKFDKAYKIVYRLLTPEELKTVSGKPKKVKKSALAEMTNETSVIVKNSFTKKAAIETTEIRQPLHYTFRCVAYFEKR